MWLDTALTAAVVLAATLGLAGTGSGGTGGSLLQWALGVAVALPLLARRRVPAGVLVGITAVAVVQSVVLDQLPGFATFLALLIGAYSVGAHAGLAVGMGAMVLCLAGVLVAGAVTEPLSAEGVIIPFVYLGGAWGIGRLVGSRTSRAARLAAEAEQLALQQAAREALAVSEERARISRELHDVIAHAVTTMVLQAGAAQAELGMREERTQARLAAIESSGRQALDELRRALSVTRSGDGVETEPMPTVAELPALAERTAASGLPVDLSVDVGSELPAGLSLSVYRIVQEALTNALKHASATRAWVRVTDEQDAIVVEVRDDGRGGSQPRVPGSGRGLIGLRERAAVFGGTVEAGADGDRGGFLVRARLSRTERAS